MRTFRLASAALVLALGVFIWRQDWPRYRSLEKGGVAGEGWVTAKGLNGGGLVNYSFMVKDKMYSGVGKAGFGTPEYDALSTDDDVIVYYLPGDPDVSSLGDPSEYLRVQSRIIIFLISFAAPVLWLALRRELRSQ